MEEKQCRSPREIIASLPDIPWPPDEELEKGALVMFLVNKVPAALDIAGTFLGDITGDDIIAAYFSHAMEFSRMKCLRELGFDPMDPAKAISEVARLRGLDHGAK